jgi:hypothetical protein
MRLSRVAVLSLSAVCAGAAVAQEPAGRPVRARTLAEDLQLFSQVMNQIRVNHPG